MAGNNLSGEVNQRSSVLWAQLEPILNTFGTLFVVFLVTRWAHYYRRTVSPVLLLCIFVYCAGSPANLYCNSLK